MADCRNLPPFAMWLAAGLVCGACTQGTKQLSAPPSKAAHVPSASETIQVRLSAEAYANGNLKVAVLGQDTYLPKLQTTAVISADPQKIAQVGSYMAGRVAAINVRLGDRVQKGQPLIEVDSIEMHQVSTEYRTALAQAQQANDTLARQELLSKEHVNAAQDLFKARTAARQASATFDEAEEHLGFLGLDAATISALRHGRNIGPLRSIVRAPIAGGVAALSVSIGQVLGGKEQLVTLVNTDPVWATLRLFESDLHDIALGSQVEFSVPTYPGRHFFGTISAMSNLIDETTRSIEVRTCLQNADGSLKPGMSAVASMALAADGQGDWLPAEAVQQHGTHDIVFVQQRPLVFAATWVTVATQRAGFVKVTSGLKPGSTVVVDGAFLLRGELERSSLGED